MDVTAARFTDEHLKEYSKKILGFAYEKTGNIFDAEDLSQEILIALFTSIPKYAKIENMDGFVYTICHHCWSNFVRKNKRHWNHANIDDMYNLNSDNDVQSEVETAIFLEKMRMEIAYLSKLHRDIITMTYYDGKSSKQISKELNISDSTVRWHLVEIRKKLKGRIENMSNENLNYKPITLRAHLTGKSGYDTKGIGHYRLVDNICYVCYGEPLTIEEIAQRLSVAAAFIEPHITELVFMDYMKIIDNNKYQTNFFIRTEAFLEIAYQYHYDNIKAKAEKLYKAVEKRYTDIKAINFVGSDLDKDFMLWILIPMLIFRLEIKAVEIIGKKKEYFCCMPKRKDGSENWIRAWLVEKDYVSSLSDEIKEFAKKSFGSFCDPWIPNEIHSLQVYSYPTPYDRPALQGREFQELSHIVDIIKNNLTTPDNHDKTLIARYAEAGYIKVEDGKIQMLIPYLRYDEYKELDKILLEAESELGTDFFVDYIEGYMNKVKSQLPDFLSENEKNYVITGISCLNVIPYYLSEQNMLRYPTDEEARRLGIIIWDMK